MTYEEEEVQHDISKLQEQVQQFLLSQRVTKNEMEVFKKGMEAKMDGLKKGMEDKMDGLNNGMEADMDGMEAKMDGTEGNMEDLKKDMEGLAKLLQEKLPNREKVVEETHDENKRNVNHDFIDYNFGFKTHHIPKIDMRKFDSKDPITWILQMEQYFELHNTQNTQKVHIATLYLEQNKFVWYRWLCSCKPLVTCSIFMEEMIAHY